MNLGRGEKPNGYTTVLNVLNIVEFPRGLELGLTVITPDSGRLPASNQDFAGDGEEGTPVQAVDAVVAAVAINRSLKLVTKDRYFGVDKGRVWGTETPRTMISLG